MWTICGTEKSRNVFADEFGHTRTSRVNCGLAFQLHQGMARLLRIARLFRLVKIASRQSPENRDKQSKFCREVSFKVRPLYELAQSITEALQGVGLMIGMNCPNLSAIFFTQNSFFHILRHI